MCRHASNFARPSARPVVRRPQHLSSLLSVLFRCTRRSSETRSRTGSIDRLHGRELGDELLGDRTEVVHDLVDALPEAGLVERDLVLLAQRLDQHVDLVEVVARDHREQVVVDLVVETAREPVHPQRALDVARGRDLELPEVGLGLALVHGHAVVANAEHQREQQPARGLAHEEKRDALEHAHTGVVRERDLPRVVEQQTDLLKRRELDGVVLVKRKALEHVHVRLQQPAETRKQKQREVEQRLVLDHKRTDRRLKCLGGHLLAPREQRHGVDVRIAREALALTAVEVGHGVVRVVLVLPPLHREALPEVAHHDADHVVPIVVRAHLVVEKVMREPPGLLVEQPHDRTGEHVHGKAVRDKAQRGRRERDAERAEHFPHVVDGRGVVEAHGLDLDAQLAVGVDEFRGALGRGLFLLGFALVAGRLVGVANVELVEQLERAGRMEHRERVRGVLAGLREHDVATRVALPLGHVVDLVVDHDPRVVHARVLADLAPREQALGLEVHHDGRSAEFPEWRRKEEEEEEEDASRAHGYGESRRPPFEEEDHPLCRPESQVGRRANSDHKRQNSAATGRVRTAHAHEPRALKERDFSKISSGVRDAIPPPLGTDGSGAAATAPTQLMTTDGSSTSDEPSPAVAALVGTIRGRIVEYKELLLRQLTDQRVALLAIEDVSPDKPKRIATTDDSAVTPPVGAVVAEEVVKREEEKPQQNGGATVEIQQEEEEGGRPATENVESAVEDVKMEEEEEMPATALANGHAEEPTEEANDRKRRASDPIEDTTADVAMADSTKTESTHAASEQHDEQQAVVPIVRAAKRMRSASTVGEQQRGLRMAQRSSTPPRRYLEHRDEVDEEVRRLEEANQLVLRSPKHPSARTTTGGPTSTGRARAMTSVEDLHADFDQKVRVTMRLQRDVTRRSVAMTRKRQLPRLPTPSRTKSHWDYLLEEMRWMAVDFSQERNWKRVMQYHLAKDVVIAQNAERVRREKENRQLARDIAMQVSAFWRTIERIAARSHVRFEGSAGSSSSGGGGSTNGDVTSDIDARPDPDANKIEGDNAESMNDMTESDEISLKFKTIEVSSTLESEAVEDTKRRVQQIFVASRRARSLLQRSPEEAAAQNCQREKAVQRLLDDRASMSPVPTTMFTTFQIIALRWMIELCLSDFNILLNDQLGMGKASTVSAFLRTMQYLEADATAAFDFSRPHLIVVPSSELHKWCFYLREWNHDCGIVQVYSGSPTHRARLRSEWTRKLAVQQFLSSEDVADLEKEDATPIYACVCGVDDFEADADAFLSFENWRTVVVENEHGGLFEDIEFVKHLIGIRQSGRRLLCCSQPLEAWSSNKIRSAYGEFLLRDGVGGDWNGDVWAKKAVLDKASASDVVRWFGNTGSALLKAQQDHLSALVVSLHCLSLRRVRSEFESELGKLEETSVACSLTSSQRTQYRNAITGFVSSSKSPTEDRLELWLQLFLKLRSVCNCVDLLNDSEKLALADMPFLFNSSTKLQNLHELLSRIVGKENRRVVVYCQLDAFFPVVEMLLALMDINYVHITGSVEMQRRALCHFALRPAVQVAMVSTRLGGVDGKQSMPVYGADAIVVLDSDWNSTCDAKLRASWAKSTVGKAFDMPVYRFHCDETIEAALLRGGSCFSEKVFSEMSPQDLVAEAAGGELKVEKPIWWSANGVYSVSPPTKLNEAMAEVEVTERYCGTEIDAASVLRVVNVELDAEEHLLLANSDELTPVEWYAVNYLYSTSTDKKRTENGEQGADDDWAMATTVISPASSRMTFEQMAVAENRRLWQEADAEADLFYTADHVDPSNIDEKQLQDVLRPLRAKGLDPHFDVMRPPEVPSAITTIDSEPISADASHQMMFRVAYREPAPPAPPPSLILKLKADTSVLQGASTDASGKLIKKKRKDLAGRVGASGTAAASAGTSSATAAGPGVKRKHDHQLQNGGSSKPPKEPRLDFDGIPLPSDMAEFADDDFWGDTNLDALDSAAWDDPAVLSGILGPTLDSSPATGSASAGAGTGTTKKKVKSGAGRAGQEAGGTGRARKGSISDSGKDGWNVQDDIVLKKLFELYGSNWTLIAHVFNTATSVSRFVFRKRTPRQCYDRYGKIISSGSLSGSSSSGIATPPGGTPTKDGTKSSGAALLKQHKLNVAAAAVWTPQVLAERIGIPSNETLLAFSARDSLPGLPPPSIVNVPSLAELTLKKKKKTQKQNAASDPASSTPSSTTPASPGGIDDLKSIRTSFDAIIQCMKRKTPPPPIPIPQPSTVTTDSLASGASGVPGTSPTKLPHSIVTPVPLVVPPPHKSHVDLVEMLPRVPLAPDDVIKRSKEAAAAAVQAAAAVASAGRAGTTPEISPLAGATSEGLGGGSFNSAAVAARKATQAGSSALAASRASNVTGAVSASKLGVAGAVWGDPSSAMRPSTAPPSTAIHAGMVSQAAMMGSAVPPTTTAVNGARGTPRPAPATGIPVTTSALLHVLDRMPEIKNKIQAILNRNDCSEAQKVAMIARLLSNTNAINATAVAAAASGNLSAAVSATIAAANANVVGAPMATSQSLDTPIPMPASLVNESMPPTSLPTSAATSVVPTAIPMPASIAASVTPGTTTTSAAAAAASSAALASALADTDMADLA